MSFKTPHKIPSVIGIFLILVMVYLVSLGSNVFFTNRSSATKNTEPKNIQVTNITDNSFTVTWLTDDKGTGAVFVTAGMSKPQTYFDERDKSGKMNQYQSHSVTIRDATPATDYSLKILSESKSYPSGNTTISVKTGNTLEAPKNSLGPAYGSVVTPDDKPATDSIVYLTFADSQIMSTLVSDSGSWLIPINLIRTKILDNYLNPDDTSQININIKNPLGDANAITNISNDSPVPVMTIGKSYNFKLQAKVTPTTSPNNLAQTADESGKSVLGAISDSVPVENPSFTITQPRENDALVSDKPLFSGTGIAGKTLTLTFSNLLPATYSLKVGKDGMWSYTPAKALNIGTQSVTAKSVDADNKSVTVTRSFDILKSGTQVLGDATPSATLMPTMTPGSTPAPTDEPTPTQLAATPTVFLTPTPRSTQAAELVAGWDMPTMILLGLGLLFITGGIVLVI